MSPTTCYEQPLNERVRALLRLEFLFQQVTDAIKCRSVWDSRMALQGLFDILALTGRNEFKGDLLKELDRYATTLNRLRQTHNVHTAILDQILADISDTMGRIHSLDNLSQEAVRQVDFLSSIHKRSHVPGGSCQFDVPALHHWLQGAPSLRVQHLRGWLSPFEPMQQAIALILRLIRQSAIPQQEIAKNGFYQRGLDCGVSHQLIRVLLPVEQNCFPEISGGKHRFTIYFLEQPDPNSRAVRSKADIEFQLACCAI